MNVSAIIVTRGDVDMEPIFDSIPAAWEIIAWDNSPIQTVAPMYAIRDYPRVCCVGPRAHGGPDLAVYGRYAAIEYASHDLIYVQDDDVFVSDPQAIVDAYEQARISQWFREAGKPGWTQGRRVNPLNGIVANMPQEFRHDGYTDSCLVGFGACFHRDLPTRAFERFWRSPHTAHYASASATVDGQHFRRTCDVVFTTLTPFILVDVDKQDREFASDDNRMWRQPTHLPERTRMLELARQVRGNA